MVRDVAPGLIVVVEDVVRLGRQVVEVIGGRVVGVEDENI